MAITKTNFINYTRCPRYVALENIKKDRLISKLTLEEYKKEEDDEQKKEIISQLFEKNEDGEEIDLTKKESVQLEAMMSYYNEVELVSGKLVEKYFPGKTVYNASTFMQESFDFIDKGIRYLCYVDIYNETEDEINIIEVKATTSKKYKEMEYGERSKEKFPLFLKKGNFYHLSSCISDNPKIIENYVSKKNKLKNRFDEGKYIYDLAVQRYIIENDFKQNNISKKVNYFLAILNSDYVYDGYKENNKRVYNSVNDEEIITFFNLNDITLEMMDIIENDKQRLEKYLNELDSNPCKVGKYCEFKKNTECIYKDICFKDVPNNNASFNYIRFVSIKDLNGISYNKYDLINSGYLKLDDIPYEWLTNKNHIIQRDCYDNNKIYVNEEKLRSFLNLLEYPIYHLDFETFPCPMPRFKGEKPYTQSCFEFSLHIEREPGVCDFDQDNYVFLAESEEDERLELVKALVANIDVTKGKMLAQNVAFENKRLEELAKVFPEYSKNLLAIRNMSFDLLYLIKTKEDFSKSLGFENTVNYYNSKQSGSYSIKKTLPLFTNLKYDDLEIKNGTEALVEYSKFHSMTKMELETVRNNLITYCKQDTWAMVEILRGLRKEIESKINV